LDQGMEAWYRTFDQDGSDEIEVNELVNMLKYLEVVVDDRLVMMLFRLFDRHNQGFFNYKDFVDILTRRMKPNFVRIVAAERERYRLNGLDIKFPDRKQKVEVRTEIQYVDKIIEKIVEKKVQVEVVREVQVQAPPRYIEVGNVWGSKGRPAKPAPVVREEIEYQDREEIEEKPVVVERIVKVPKKKKRVKPAPDMIEETRFEQPLSESGEFFDEGWGEDDYVGPSLQRAEPGVFRVNEATMSYCILISPQSDTNFYFSLETKALH